MGHFLRTRGPFYWLVLIVASLGLCAHADSTSVEVEYLLGYLQKSGCRFNRNGTWYSSAKAADHLHKKYAYLVKKGWLTSTESFIEKGASTSSMSGKPYQVQCLDSAAVSSGPWLKEKLDAFRSTQNQATPPESQIPPTTSNLP